GSAPVCGRPRRRGAWPYGARRRRASWWSVQPFAHEGGEVDNTTGIAPLVVVPAHHLAVSLTHNHGQRRVDDRRMGITLEVGRHQLLIGHCQNPFEVAGGGLSQCLVDDVDRNLVAEAGGQV